jgi:hypothetical protein
MDDWVQPASRGELPRREVMQTPEEVAAMLRLKDVGVGCAADRRRTGVQPYDSSPVFGGGQLDSVSRSRSAANTGRA